MFGPPPPPPPPPPTAPRPTVAHAPDTHAPCRGAALCHTHLTRPRRAGPRKRSSRSTPRQTCRPRAAPSAPSPAPTCPWRGGRRWGCRCNRSKRTRCRFQLGGWRRRRQQRLPAKGREARHAPLHKSASYYCIPCGPRRRAHRPLSLMVTVPVVRSSSTNTSVRVRGISVAKGQPGGNTVQAAHPVHHCRGRKLAS